MRMLPLHINYVGWGWFVEVEGVLTFYIDDKNQ